MWTRVCCLALLLLSACDRPSTPASTDLTKKIATSRKLERTPFAKDQPARRPVPKDGSLTIKAYIAAGVPSPDRNWSGAEYVQAAKVLGKYPDALPRHGSAKSGQVFSHITSDANFALVRNKNLPIVTRLRHAVQYMGGLNMLLKTYGGAFQKRKVGDRDIVELLHAILRITATLFDLVHEFLPTLDKNDPNYPTRLRGLEKMKSGSANIVFGALDTTTERNAYRTAERVRLMKYIVAVVPRFAPRLAPTVQQELLVRLRTMKADPTLPEIRRQIEQLIATLARK